MKVSAWLLSVAIHGAVIGVVTLGLSRTPSSPEALPIPVFFEVVEATALDAAERPEALAPEEERLAQATPAEPEEEAPPSAEEVPLAAEDEGKAPEGRKESSEADEVMEPADKPPPEEVAPPESGDRQMAVEQDEEHATVVSDPIALNRIVPVYPRVARRKGHEGIVEVEVSVMADGRIKAADVITASGYAELDAAALAAVRSARFAPAQVDGVSVQGRLRLTFAFKLK